MDYDKITAHVSNVTVKEPQKNIEDDDLILKQLHKSMEKFLEKDDTSYAEQADCLGKLTTIDSIIQI